MKPLALLSLTGLALATPTLTFANWTQWRGPSGNGVAAPGHYPEAFSPSKNVSWKCDLPSGGSSTPVVWESSLFITSDIDGQDGALCLSNDGTERWRQTLGASVAGKHQNATGSNPSPVTDGERLYVYYKSGTLAALDTASGKVLWKDNLQERFGKDTLWWDLGTSPVLAEGKVIVAVMHEGESYLAAFDQVSGALAWKTARNFPCEKESDQSYTTPIVLSSADKTTLITWGADHLTAHDAANGKELWFCGGFNPGNKAMWRVIASPAIANDIVVVPFGRAKFLAGVKLGGSGDVTKTHRVWKRDDLGADVPSPVGHDGKAYLLADNGEITCLETATGKTLWEARLPKNASKYYASPVLAGDRLYCAREDGAVMCGQVSAEGFKLLAENDLGERIIATPVVLNDRVYIRAGSQLYCFASATKQN